MSNSLSISVLVGVYNSSFDKLRRTTLSIIKQIDVDLEIIFCDDCSDKSQWDKIESLLNQYNFQNYRIIIQDKNIGTVSNLYSGVSMARGNFVYCISPGDYLYSETILSDFVRYALYVNADVVFGNAVYYSVKNDMLVYLDDVADSPIDIKKFDIDADFKECAISFFMGYKNYLLGPTILRKKSCALKYFELINGVSRYVEDNTTIAFGFADNSRPIHYDKYLVWYEYGTGVSTNGSEKWQKLLKEDYDRAYSKLRNYSKNNKLIHDIVSINRMSPREKLVYLIHNNIYLLLRLILIKLRPQNIRKCNIKKFEKKFIEELY